VLYAEDFSLNSRFFYIYIVENRGQIELILL
jgi:hypothetical protein